MSAANQPEVPTARSPFFTTHFFERARSGLDEAGLVEALGPNGILLRATFGYEGRLVWGAMRGRNQQLELVAQGQGSPGDLQRLRCASGRHDFSMAIFSWKARSRDLRLLFRRGKVAIECGLSRLAAGEGFDDIQAGLKKQIEGPGFEGLVNAFRALSWPLEGNYDRAWLSAELAALPKHLLDWQPKAGLRGRLAEVTREYLRQVSEIWDLSGLAPLLLPETELVIQMEDALHSAPIGFLELEGQPLYRRVKTVRTSLAPQLDHQMEQLDRVSEESSSPKHLLSLSYFRPDDRAAQTAGAWLHRGQLLLAREFEIDCIGAEGAQGTVNSLRAALDHYGSFSTVAICGHGNFELAGIELGGTDDHPALWNGHGCDFSKVEWLILVSCSIGRVSLTGDLDVEGFCVQLSIHRARSILACRWPVLGLEAVAFANSAIRHYLMLEPSKENRRALALAAARQEVCDGPNPLVSLNTAAAFELYGLG